MIIKGFSCHLDGFGLMTFYVLSVVSVLVRPSSRTTLSKDSFSLVKRSGTFIFFHHPHCRAAQRFPASGQSVRQSASVTWEQVFKNEITNSIFFFQCLHGYLDFYSSLGSILEIRLSPKMFISLTFSVFLHTIIHCVLL